MEGIVEGQDFKNRVNELAKGDKRKKEEIRNKLIGEIEIEGRYGPPKVKDLFGVRLIVGVWELVKYIIATVRWHWLYTVRKIEPLKEDES